MTAVYDVRAAVAEERGHESGANACTRLVDGTANADVIVPVVTDERAQRDVFTNRKDNLLRNPAGKVFINCATIRLHTHEKMEKFARKT